MIHCVIIVYPLINFRSLLLRARSSFDNPLVLISEPSHSELCCSNATWYVLLVDFLSLKFWRFCLGMVKFSSNEYNPSFRARDAETDNRVLFCRSPHGQGCEYVECAR